MKRSILPLSILTALALGVRLIGLEAESLWHDEAGTVDVVRQESLAQVVGKIAGAERQGPVFYLLLRAWDRDGAGAAYLRLLCVLLGVPAIPLLYFLALRWFGGRAAFWAAAFLAFSQYHVYYCQELRAYAAGMTFALASTLAVVRLVERFSWTALGLYAATAALALATTYHCALIVAVQAAYALWKWRRGQAPGRIWLAPAAAAAAGLALAPLVWLQVATGSHTWLARPSIYTPYNVLLNMSGGVYIDDCKNLLAELAALVLTLWLIDRALHWREKKEASAWAFLFFLFPLAASFAVSFRYPVLFQGSRYMIVVLPFFHLLLAAGAASLRPRLGNTIAAVFLALSVGFLVVGHRTAQKRDWRAAAQIIQRDGLPGDLVISRPADSVRVVAFYLGDDYKTDMVGKAYMEEEFSGRLAGCANLWLVSALEEPGDLEQELALHFDQPLAVRISISPLALRLARFTPRQ